MPDACLFLPGKNDLAEAETPRQQREGHSGFGQNKEFASDVSPTPAKFRHYAKDLSESSCVSSEKRMLGNTNGATKNCEPESEQKIKRIKCIKEAGASSDNKKERDLLRKLGKSKVKCTCKQPIHSERCALRNAHNVVLHPGADCVSAEEYAWLQHRAAARAAAKAKEKWQQDVERERQRKAEKRLNWSRRFSSNGQSFWASDWYCWQCGDLRFRQHGAACRCGARDGAQCRGQNWYCRRCGESHDRITQQCDICLYEPWKKKK